MLYNINKKTLRQTGSAALLTIVIISAVSLVFLISSARKSIDEVNRSVYSARSEQSLAVAEACLEETLLKIRKNHNYGLGAGVINLTLEEATCDVSVTGSLNDRTIVAQSSLKDFYKKIQIDLTLSGNNLVINSWQELEN